jgi:hypothetical protein
MSAWTSVLVTGKAVRFAGDGTPPTRRFVIEVRNRDRPVGGPYRSDELKAKFFTANALAAAVTLGSLAPAFADGAASTRNILIGGAAAAIGIVNWSKKRRAKQEELREQARRQAQYRSYFYNKYGYYPNNDQFRDWYFRTYGVNPS